MSTTLHVHPRGRARKFSRTSLSHSRPTHPHRTQPAYRSIGIADLHLPTAVRIGIASTAWTHVHVIATLDCGDPKGNRRATARPPPHHAPAHAAERSPCARSAPKISLHLAADFRPPVTPSVQIFTLRYENLFCPESVPPSGVTQSYLPR